jgi:hypothetical protein
MECSETLANQRACNSWSWGWCFHASSWFWQVESSFLDLHYLKNKYFRIYCNNVGEVGSNRRNTSKYTRLTWWNWSHYWFSLMLLRMNGPGSFTTVMCVCNYIYTRVHTTRNGQLVHCTNSKDYHVIHNSSSEVPIHNFKQVGVAWHIKYLPKENYTLQQKKLYMVKIAIYFSTRWPIFTKFRDNILWHY